MDPLLTLGVTTLATLAGVYATYRVSNRRLRTDGSNTMIDQLQEENAELRKERAADRRTIRIQGDYIGQLRRHVAEAQPPPPPPFPDGLII